VHGLGRSLQGTSPQLPEQIKNGWQWFFFGLPSQYFYMSVKLREAKLHLFYVILHGIELDGRAKKKHLPAIQGQA
jgi:hypothetical protein